MYKKYEKLQFIKLYFQVYITANTLLTTQHHSGRNNLELVFRGALVKTNQ